MKTSTFDKKFMQTQTKKKIIQNITDMVWRTSGEHDTVNNILSLSMKWKMYNCIMTVLLYSSDTWNITKDLEKKIKRAKCNMRSILCTTLRDWKQTS